MPTWVPVAASLSQDLPKLVLLGGVALAILMLARWSSHLGDSTPTFPPPELPPQHEAKPVAFGVNPEDLRFLPRDLRLAPVRIQEFYFLTFDAATGPIDPVRFCDELIVKFYNPDSDWTWFSSFLVATPDGLTDELNKHHWKYLRTGHVIVLTRYDVKDILEAVVDFVIEDRTRQPIDENAPEELEND